MSATIYECDKNICICVCASVSLFDVNDHKERKVSRRKISLYKDTVRSKICTCHAVSHLMKMFNQHFSSMMKHFIDV